MSIHIKRNQKIGSPMVGAGLIALILLVTGFTLVSMHSNDQDQMRSSVALNSTANSEQRIDR